MEIDTNQILNQLTPRQRQIIQMRADWYSYKDIAKELGIKEQSVRLAVMRIRKKVSTNTPKKAYIDMRKRDIMTFEENLKKIDIDTVKRAKNTLAMYPELENGVMTWEDLAQDLRIHLMNKFDLFDPKKSSFRTWAFKVMKNKIKDAIRDSCVSEDVLDQPDTLSIEELQEKGIDI